MTTKSSEPPDPLSLVPWPMFAPWVYNRLVNRHRDAVSTKEAIMKNTARHDPAAALALAHQQLVASFAYVSDLLEQTPQYLWQTSPAGMGSHIAWQLGHLVMARHRLCIYFVRPVTRQDDEIVSASWMEPYRRGSQASDQQTAIHTPEVLWTKWQTVHQYVLDQWPAHATLDLQSPAMIANHRIVKTKLDALLWASQHEMIHAGQIGMIRRGLGLPSLW